jgi:CheY-like chemotaxis protein
MSLDHTPTNVVLPQPQPWPALGDPTPLLAQRERLHAVGQLAPGIAHDVNNALAMIVGYSDLLLADPTQLDDPEVVREYLAVISAAAQDAAGILGGLGEFYRGARRDEPSKTVDLNSVVQQTVLLSRPKWRDQAQTTRATVEIRTDLQPVPPLRGDACALRELLLNLIFNAVDALPNGGTITIRTAAAGGLASLAVSDNGVGMTESVRRRCLEPFFTTKQDAGTGLGLAMVQGIVRRHAGWLEVESQPGRGTTVSISLPVQSCPPRPDPPAAGHDRPPSQRVLVIDDDPRIRLLLRRLLMVDGHSVETSAGGRDGLRRFQTGRFDVVMTDYAMPDLSGEQVAAAIKNVAPDRPVVLLTGFGDLLDLPASTPPGVDLVLSKPVTLRALRQALVSVARLVGPRA